MVSMTKKKKKKEPYPTAFSSFSREELDRLLQDEEDEPMTKKNDKKTEKKGKPASRKTLAPEDLVRMVEDWDDKTVSEWAKEFSVSYQTLLKMAQAINKEDKTLCPPKPKKATRADTAKATIALFKKKKGKK